MLPREQRQAVRDLLEAALSCEPATRAQFIRDASHGDEALSDEALRLLERIEATHADTSSDLRSTSETLDWVLRDLPDAGRAAAAAPQEFVGTARFEVRRTLGSGGFGTVYESYDREQHQLVALKVLRRSDPVFLYRFKREFRALVDIRHQNLVELYELFSERDAWFFTMELVRGTDFLRYVARRDRAVAETGCAACDVARLRLSVVQLAEGILALHGAGLVHRDVKPGNVLVTPDGRVRLLDFGLVREMDLSSAASVAIVGTPAYMAPEQRAQLPSGTAADWYSFGVMLFQALTGSLPRRTNPFATSQPSPIVALELLVDVPHDLKTLCRDLLDPDPATRPPGVDVLRRLGAASRPEASDVPASADELVIGQEPQLSHLRELLELTRRGRAVVVNVSGESGIGKSTLLRSFRRTLARTDPDIVILTGRCHQNETVPYKGLDDLVDGLSNYLKALPPIEVEALVPRDAPSLIRMFPVLAQVEGIASVRRKSMDVVDAQELRRRAFASLQDLFARLSERQTLVLAIDDLQWSDLDSAAFLRDLFVTLSPPSVLFIASYRAEDANTSPFLQSWRYNLAGAASLTV